MKRILTALLICGLLLCGAPAVLADEKTPNTRELTIDQAVELALKHSYSLKKGQNSIDSAYEARLLSAYRLVGVSVDERENFQAIRFMSNLQQADARWRSAKKSVTLVEDSVTYATHKAYTDILLTEANIRLAEVDKKNAETQRTIAQARYRVGMSQLLDLEKAEAEVIRTKAALEDAHKTLDNNYLELNYLIGFWPQDRPVLMDMPEFEKLVVADITSYIARSLADNPNQWIKENDIFTAKYALDAYDPSTSGTSYLGLEIAVDQSILTAEEAKEQYKKSLYSLYNTILKMEENLPTIEQNILIAREGLRITQLMHETGMATRAEVIAAETSLVRVEKSRIDLICQHDVQKLAFLKPWAIGM